MSKKNNHNRKTTAFTFYYRCTARWKYLKYRQRQPAVLAGNASLVARSSDSRRGPPAPVRRDAQGLFLQPGPTPPAASAWRCPRPPTAAPQHPTARRPSSGAVGAALHSLQQLGKQGRVTFLDTQSTQQGLVGTSNTFSEGFFKYQGGNRTVIVFFFCKVKFLWLPPNLPPPCANTRCCQGALQDL